MPKFIYTGDGLSFYEGVPARDLEEADWAALDLVQQAAVTSGKLYAPPSPQKPKPATADPAPTGGNA